MPIGGKNDKKELDQTYNQYLNLPVGWLSWFPVYNPFHSHMVCFTPKAIFQPPELAVLSSLDNFVCADGNFSLSSVGKKF